jgi:hypothetical protein
VRQAVGSLECACNGTGPATGEGVEAGGEEEARSAAESAADVLETWAMDNVVLGEPSYLGVLAFAFLRVSNMHTEWCRSAGEVIDRVTQLSSVVQVRHGRDIVSDLPCNPVMKNARFPWGFVMKSSVHSQN